MSSPHTNDTTNKPATVKQGWNDYLYSGLSLASVGISVPTLTTFRDGLKANAFTGAGVQINEAFGSIHMLHDFVAGSTIFPHLHWGHNEASPSGNVRWGLEYSFAKGHDLQAFPASSEIILTQAAGVQYTHQLIEDATGISSANLEPDSILNFRLFRDPAHVDDTFTGDAFIFHVDMHVEVNNIVTNEKVSPFTKNSAI